MDLPAIVMGIAFALMWSSAFTSARLIVTETPPLHALALRFALSGGIAVAIARGFGGSWHLTAAQWRAVIVFGICQNAFYLGLYWIAMRTVPAGLAAIIASSMPLLVAFAGWAALRQPLAAQAWAGLAAGLAGVALIMGARIGAGADTVGVGLCVAGVLALTFATLSVRGTASGGNVLMIVGLQMLIGSAALWPAAVLLETPEVTVTPVLLAAFAYTILVPGLAATIVWFWLVNRIGAVRAATFHFLNPVFGVGIAALLLGERVGPVDAAGVVIITLGILAVQTAPRR